MLQRASALTLVALAIGCSATATSNPALRNEDGGSGGIGAANPSTGGGSSRGGVSGAVGSGGSPSSSAGGSAAGSALAGGGSSSAGGSVGSGGSGGSGNTGPVSVGLPFTEDFESGMIKPNLWSAIDTQLADPANTGWSVVSDDTGKGAQLTGAGTERFLVGGSRAWTDQKVELRVKTVSGKPEIDVAFRFHAAKEYYYIEFADSHFKLRDRRSGANDDVDPAADKPAVTLGTWYKLGVQIKGTAITASLDDVVILTGDFVTTPIAAGGIAIGIGNGSGVAQFDDIHVTLP